MRRSHILAYGGRHLDMDIGFHPTKEPAAVWGVAGFGGGAPGAGAWRTRSCPPERAAHRGCRGPLCRSPAVGRDPGGCARESKTHDASPNTGGGGNSPLPKPSESRGNEKREITSTFAAQAVWWFFSPIVLRFGQSHRRENSHSPLPLGVSQ